MRPISSKKSIPSIMFKKQHVTFLFWTCTYLRERQNSLLLLTSLIYFSLDKKCFDSKLKLLQLQRYLFRLTDDLA